MLDEIRALLPDGVVLETVNRDIGLETPFSGPLVEAMTAVLGRHDPGAPVLPYLLSGGTDNKALAKLGSPATVSRRCDCPPTSTSRDSSTASTSGVPLDALEFGTAALTDLLLTY